MAELPSLVVNGIFSPGGHLWLSKACTIACVV